MGDFWARVSEKAYVPDYYGFDEQNAWMTVKWGVLILAILMISILSQSGPIILASLLTVGIALVLAISLVRKVAWNIESKEEVAMEFTKNYWNTRAYRRYLDMAEA